MHVFLRMTSQNWIAFFHFTLKEEVIHNICMLQFFSALKSKADLRASHKWDLKINLPFFLESKTPNLLHSFMAWNPISPQLSSSVSFSIIF
jgi:hypothetical protein